MTKNARVYNRNTASYGNIRITSENKPRIQEAIIQKWQSILDVLTDILEIPAALIMHVHESEIEVFVTADHPENPYKRHASDQLGHGLYCETVMDSGNALEVKNALHLKKWKDNPDIRLGMTYYYGLPLHWGDGEIFGTICILDYVERNLDERFKKLMEQFRSTVEDDLQLLVQNVQLAELNDILANDCLTTDVRKEVEDLSAFIAKQTNQPLAIQVDCPPRLDLRLPPSALYYILSGFFLHTSICPHQDGVHKHASLEIKPLDHLIEMRYTEVLSVSGNSRAPAELSLMDDPSALMRAGIELLKHFITTKLHGSFHVNGEGPLKNEYVILLPN